MTTATVKIYNSSASPCWNDFLKWVESTDYTINGDQVTVRAKVQELGMWGFPVRERTDVVVYERNGEKTRTVSINGAPVAEEYPL